MRPLDRKSLSLALRVVWWVALGGLATVGAGYGIDRQARRDSVLAATVPEFFRNFAQQALVESALEAGNDSGTVDAAKLLISRRPMPEESLAYLGIAAVRVNDNELGRRALAGAAGRGWRVPVAQIVVAASAYDIQSWDVAGNRLAALWRTASLDERVYGITQAILTVPEVRSSFAGGIANYEPAVRAFVEWAGVGLDPGVLRNELALLVKHGAVMRCADIGRQAGNLAIVGRADAAQVLWDGVCSRKETGVPSSLAFTSSDDNFVPGPFDWRYREEEGVKLSVARIDGQYQLAYENTDPVIRTLASKITRFTHGAHYGSWRSAQLATSEAMAPYLQVECVGQVGGRSYMVRQALNEEMKFELPTNHCSVQRVSLQAGRGTGGPGVITIR